jgi:hypothetical protein
MYVESSIERGVFPYLIQFVFRSSQTLVTPQDFSSKTRTAVVGERFSMVVLLPASSVSVPVGGEASWAAS